MSVSHPVSRHDPDTLQWRGYRHHPLDLIPLFRRWAPSALRSYVYTTLICLAVAVAIMLFNAAFGLAPTVAQLTQYAVIALCIGLCQQAIFDAMGFVSSKIRFGRPTLVSTAIAIGAPTLGLYGGFLLSAMLLGGGPWYAGLFSRTNLLVNTFIVLLVALFIWHNASNQEKIQRAELDRARADAAAEAAKRETTNAELKTLRAQVEPHFLYNTLANVVSLIDRDPPQAKRMTERLIGYLRHTLDASRRDHATVGDELVIIGDYLEILRLRMGERLTYSINAEAAARALPLAPMLLQPLVENAIKHGLEPKIEGGHIAITATASAEQLRIQIDDNGLGFGASADTAGLGSGLANMRARLAALYGDAARLAIELPASGAGGGAQAGTRVAITIALPARSAQSTSASKISDSTFH
jgi:Histidine kinase